MKYAIKPYWSLLRQQLISRLQFRAAFFSKITTNTFWGFVRAIILFTYITHGAEQPGLTAAQAVGMVWLGQIAMNLMPGAGMDFGVWDSIKTGGVAYELLRPMNLYANWFTRAIAVKLAPFLSAVVPITAVALLIPGGLGLMPPVSPAHLLACVVTLMTGLLVSCGWILISYALLMDARFGDAVSRLSMSIVQLLAGGILPLQLWPERWQAFLKYQPFAGIMDLPLRFYVGAAPLYEFPGIVALQLIWGAVFIALGNHWIKRTQKLLVIQGG